jgi:hypothetical protein
MVLDIVLAPMALAAKTFNVGETVRVTVSFKYAVGVNTTAKILAGPYYTNIFGKHMVDSCVLMPSPSRTTSSSSPVTRPEGSIYRV